MSTANEFQEFRVAIDRSTLEQWKDCPMQARLLAGKKRTVGVAAVSGEEGHQAISRTIARALPGWDDMSPRDFSSMLGSELRAARPDVQPDVVEAFQSVAWKLGDLFAQHTSRHVLKYDGGEGEQSGQMDKDFGEFRVTSEIDLLMATQAKTLLREHDWKSGWKFHDIDMVRDSLQFQLHAVLVLSNYPDCEELEVAVWNTRKGQRLPYVTFPRTKLPQYEARIRSYLDIVARFEELPIAEVPCWPSTEKCRLCDAAIDCPAAERELSADPVGLLKQRIALGARLDAMDKLLQAAVTRQGAAIRTEDGDCYGKFGAEKPRETWKLKAGKSVDSE
jgi:hypothetical protein